eukprot:TRINITY_DN65930_c4_g1_i2.p2 TRINITY_DN65930_c4_g1~~TRINITY_DN65930_c4_g1_i2.p2  ORF type:complete len:129 (+),score=75.08 TRINITY_DN65930_c4_g1_i2:339-725(+)
MRVMVSPKALQELSHYFKVDENVIRTLTVKLPTANFAPKAFAKQIARMYKQQDNEAVQELAAEIEQDDALLSSQPKIDVDVALAKALEMRATGVDTDRQLDKWYAEQQSKMKQRKFPTIPKNRHQSKQ